MIGLEKAQSILQRVLACSQADQTEAVLWGQDSSLTRFANSSIHQNVAESNTELRVRVALGKRIGVASINNLSDEAIAKVMERATTIAQHQEENPDFVSLPDPEPVPLVKGFVDKTAACPPGERARLVGIICRKALDKGLNAAGALTTARQELAVANSLGIFGYYPTTLADISTVVMSASGSGYASHVSTDVGTIDAEALADEAMDKALRSSNPGDIEPGEYEVILEEYAVSDLLDFLGYLGFSALAVQEERSFMKGKLGQKVMGDNVSIWDDGLDPKGLPVPFDFEGVPKRRVPLIEKGVARGVVYDSYTAGREGKSSTGHALPAPNTWGPFPLNMFMQPGEATKEQMVRATERGIWVTRFWYTRPVHPLHVVITGMTRDGTFLVEKGEITRPVKNLRFTQSYLEALSHVDMIGSKTKLLQAELGASCVPALKMGRFTFTGITQF